MDFTMLYHIYSTSSSVFSLQCLLTFLSLRKFSAPKQPEKSCSQQVIMLYSYDCNYRNFSLKNSDIADVKSSKSGDAFICTGAGNPDISVSKSSNSFL